MYHFLECVNVTCELELAKLNHEMESMNDMMKIQFMESGSVYTEAENGIIAKIVSAIKAIIAAIGKMVRAIVDNTIGRLIKLFKKGESIEVPPQNANTMIEVETIEDHQKALNEYIKQMVVLERKAMNLKYDVVSGKDAYLSSLEVNKIQKEIDQLNAKYEKLLESDGKIIKVALKDAIRFNEKQLMKVKIDFTEVEKESSKILKTFSEDAEGCEHPDKVRLIQKISNSIGTMYRKHIRRCTTLSNKTSNRIARDLVNGVMKVGGTIGGAVVGGVTAATASKMTDIALKAMNIDNAEAVKKFEKFVSDATKHGYDLMGVSGQEPEF